MYTHSLNIYLFFTNTCFWWKESLVLKNTIFQKKLFLFDPIKFSVIITFSLIIKDHQKGVCISRLLHCKLTFADLHCFEFCPASNAYSTIRDCCFFLHGKSRICKGQWCQIALFQSPKKPSKIWKRITTKNCKNIGHPNSRQPKSSF